MICLMRPPKSLSSLVICLFWDINMEKGMGMFKILNSREEKTK